MKNLFCFFSFTMMVMICLIFGSCSKGTSKGGDGDINTVTENGSNNKGNLNLSIVIDLSDRLTRDNVDPSQMANDTAIINYFIDYFIDYSKQQDPIKCKNKFQILFYPTPSDLNINKLSRNLNIDLSKIAKNDKRVELTEMKSRVDETLDVIYNKTLEAKKWEGSDIWDFFSNKQVDKLCIKDGYRNIVAILTDGYLYHVNHKIKEDNSYSYILPQTLANNGKLISRRNDLANVEVIILEVNPYNRNERDQLVQVLQDWFLDMGLDRANLSINETDVENRTETIIDNFLNN